MVNKIERVGVTTPGRDRRTGGGLMQAPSQRGQSGQETLLNKQQSGTELPTPQGMPAAPQRQAPAPEHQDSEHQATQAASSPPPEPKAVTDGAQPRDKEPQTPDAEEPAATQLESGASHQQGGADAADVVQRVRRKALASCQSLALVDHEVLSMVGYPDNEVLEMARRRRDLWAILCILFAIIFLLGLIGLIHAVIAGLAFGALAAALSLAIPQIRRIYMDTPSHRELLKLRRELERNARAHIQFLEGKQGLACNFQMLVDYNGALRERGYQWLMQLSDRGILLPMLRGRARIRLYQHLLYEAEKAYERLKEAYLAQENARTGLSSISDEDASSDQPVDLPESAADSEANAVTDKAAEERTATEEKAATQEKEHASEPASDSKSGAVSTDGEAAESTSAAPTGTQPGL